MANPFYTYSGAFIPGTLARAEQVGTEYTSVQAGFAILAIQGVDSGSANTYVVTTNGGPSGAYADGNIVEFKAATSNTGASTINVNGLGVVSLTNFSGQALTGGAITASTWYRAIYNSTYSAFTLIAPTSLVITSNTISSSAPTHLVGLTPAGGSSTACAPIDVTFAIDQSIAPTWTGAHTFANAVTFNSTVAFAGGLSLTGGSSQYAATLTGSASAGHSLGLEVNAGVNTSDIALLINSQNSGTQFFEINGVGSVTVGTPTGGAQGVGTINATGLFVNGAAVKTTSVSSANPTASVGLAAVNGTAATFMTSDSAPALSQAIAPTWTAAHTFTPSSAVTAVTINAAVNANGLNIIGGTNTANAYLARLISGQGSGFSSGLLVQAGTTTADSALTVNNAANTKTFLQARGDGAVLIGSPANPGGGAGNLTVGGIAGPLVRIQDSGAAGAILDLQATNTAVILNSNFVTGPAQPLNLQIGGTTVFQVLGTTAPTIKGYGPTAAGLVDSTPDTGTFTVTYTGMTTTVTGTVAWSRIGNLVILFFPAATGSSNANTFTATGLPAAIQPARTQQVGAPALCFENNGNPAAGSIGFTGGSGIVTFGLGGIANNWTAGNTGKGVQSAFSVAYVLN